MTVRRSLDLLTYAAGQIAGNLLPRHRAAVDNLAEALRLLGDFAARTPWQFSFNEDHGEHHFCRFCGVMWLPPGDPEDHLADCLWVKARVMVGLPDMRHAERGPLPPGGPS